MSTNPIIECRLSPREWQIMHLLANGDRVVEIAESLKLSIKTVYSYRHRILTKTGYPNNVTLAVAVLSEAVPLNWVDVPKLVRITDDDRRLIRLIASGRSVVQIAAAFFRSSKTIHNRCKRVMTKLGLDDMRALKNYAVQERVKEAGLSPSAGVLLHADGRDADHSVITAQAGSAAIPKNPESPRRCEAGQERQYLATRGGRLP